MDVYVALFEVVPRRLRYQTDSRMDLIALTLRG